MFTNSSIPVLPASDNSTYYLSLQPQSNINNKTNATYANPGLTFNPGTGVLNLNVANANMQGSVIQVQSFTLQAQFTTTTHGGPGTASQPGSSGTDTPLTINIKPKYATSKILVSVKGTAGYAPAVAVWLGVMKRTGIGNTITYSPPSGASSMINSWSMSSYIAGAAASTIISILPFNFDWLDSPNTTNLLTYTLRIAGAAAGATIGIGTGDTANLLAYGGICNITAMEIGQ